MEKFIDETMQENFQLLRIEGGHTITPESMENAKMVVMNYWRKLRKTIEKVTQAEVPLILPEQLTPEGRKFTLQGVVDVITDESGTMIYDIKTVDVNSIQGNLDFYKAQLSVYAYVWKTLKNKPLNGCAIIAVGMTDELKEAIKTDNPKVLETAIANWNPVVEIEVDDYSIEEAIHQFGEIIDKIESCQFNPRHWKELDQPYTKGSTKSFAKHVCHNCDVRFSCDSYKKYAER